MFLLDLILIAPTDTKKKEKSIQNVELLTKYGLLSISEIGHCALHKLYTFRDGAVKTSFVISMKIPKNKIKQ